MFSLMFFITEALSYVLFIAQDNVSQGLLLVPSSSEVLSTFQEVMQCT